METQPTLYVFMGFPGAGKSTASQLIARLTGANHIWADHERHKMFANATHSKPESEVLYQVLNERAEAMLANGQSVVYDTNFNYRKDRELMRDIAGRHAARTLIVWMTTPKELCRERATHPNHRDRNGYHDTMTDAQFDRLTDHVESPEVHEDFITIDGTHIDELVVKRQLGI